MFTKYISISFSKTPTCKKKLVAMLLSSSMNIDLIYQIVPSLILNNGKVWLQPDTSTPKEQLNFKFLVARFFIWHCKVRKMYPTIDYFTRFFAYFKK